MRNLRSSRQASPILAESNRSSLDRFLQSQSAPFNKTATPPQTVFEKAMAELRSGRKTSHWVWFVFPQLAGLGVSALNRYFALASVDEARRYAEHDVLGPRLREAVGAVLACEEGDVVRLFGETDWVKVRSCLTLFAAVEGPGESVFRRALRERFGGEACLATLEMVEEERAGLLLGP
ncbi:hypothetical protein HYQ45_000876 [Verticillium longisporum]|uniref:Calpastatin n=1 Tax=Verticillium longisporum TaxID=100787 RepID=A0A8I3A0B7_VERLO|nr:hypothetical protein HYQ45_000876 [Verticillium longisporum]